MKPDEQQALQKVLIAGMQLMYDKGTFKIFRASMVKPGPLPQKLAREAAGLVKILQDKANGAIPRPLLIPAAYLLMLEIARFMEDAELAKPTPQDIAAAFKLMVPLMAKEFKNVTSRVTPTAGMPPVGGGMLNAPPPQQPGV